MMCITLPTEITPAAVQAENLKVLLYGSPKIGKSTFCAQIPDAVFLDCENGLKFLNTKRVPVTSWKDFMTACALLAQTDKHNFKTIVIDTLDAAIALCEQYICEEYNVRHITELEYGKGNKLVESEVLRVIRKLSLFDTGLVLVAHTEERTVKGKTGEYPKVTTSIPKRLGERIGALVDIIGYCTTEYVNGANGYEYERVLKTASSPVADAGDRTRTLPETLPLDYGIFASYVNGEKHVQQ